MGTCPQLRTPGQEEVEAPSFRLEIPWFILLPGHTPPSQCCILLLLWKPGMILPPQFPLPPPLLCLLSANKPTVQSPGDTPAGSSWVPLLSAGSDSSLTSEDRLRVE